jgi:hypothetical protein
MAQCYACSVTDDVRLKQCSHCKQWSCGDHAEYHIYTAQGHAYGDEVICHDCEHAGIKPLGPDEQLTAFLKEIKRLKRAEKSQVLKKRKQDRKQQSSSRKKNR